MFIVKKTVICIVLPIVLSACGSGGSSSTNLSPINVNLISVQAESPTAVNMSWSLASDDSTPANQLIYEVHAVEGDNMTFSPSLSSLKYSGKNITSIQLTNLKAVTIYTIKLVVTDTQGLSTISSGFTIKTISSGVLTGLLNDSGVTQCTYYNMFFADCNYDSRLYDWFGINQDGEVGRDFLATRGELLKAGAGDGGFDFTKISETGQTLPANATKWDCVLDNHTGLLWEVKTDDGGLRDKDNIYQFYDTDLTINDGNNAQTYTKLVNTQVLCGYSDWRLPNRGELHSIVNYSKHDPAIDSIYFPNTQIYEYWSSSFGVKNTTSVWTVNFSYGYDGNGTTYDKGSKTYRNYVRLVRSVQ